MTRMEQLITRLEITQQIQITRNRYNISNTNNIGNMGHLTKEQLTWWFWNTAGIRMYLQLPLTWAHTFFICMIHVKVKMIWIAAERGIGFYTWYLLFIFWAERKCLVRRFCSEEQHPPWSYSILFVLCCYWTTLIWHLCEWKYVIVNLLGRVYQAVKMMTLPGNKNQKKIRRRRRKEKTLLTQVMF